MKIYLTYYRYDRDENYDIYHLDFTKKSSIQHWKDKDLPSFLGYGPDDVSYLVLKEVDISKTDLTKLIELYVSSKECDTELINFMTQIHYGDGEEIFFTSGDEIWEVLEFFRDSGKYDLSTLFGVDVDTLEDDDITDKCQELLFGGSDDLGEKVLKDYIRINY
jgi:hypothetical protein